MKSLQNLWVELTDGSLDEEYPDRDEVVHLLKPMMAVRFPKYVVQFDWPVEVDELARFLGSELPFEIQIKINSAEQCNY